MKVVDETTSLEWDSEEQMTAIEAHLVEAAQEALGVLRRRYGFDDNHPALKPLRDAVREALEPANTIVERAAGSIPSGSGV